MNSRQDHLIDTLASSKIFQDYEQAFAASTGLPVALRSAGSWQLPHHHRRNENAFCALMAGKSRACAACLQVQQQLSDSAVRESKTVTCQHGLCDSVVPVRLGEQLIGYLQTGQIFRKRPTTAQFARTAQLLADWGLELDQRALKDAYFATRVLSPKQYESMLRLLGIFAQHLSMVSYQMVVRQENSQPPVITRAREFIEGHHAEDLSLTQVAKVVNTSTYYFCKMFRKATGINFTDYLSRVRIEKAKNLLLNPNLRVSEIAFEVGFQSLTHFNRVFKKATGINFTDYLSRVRIEKAKNLLINPNLRVSEIAYEVGFQSLTHFNRVFRKMVGQSPTEYRDQLPHL
jgi:AraC-like DNA-binding protein/ligand-binding sensor protein